MGRGSSAHNFLTVGNDGHKQYTMIDTNVKEDLKQTNNETLNHLPWRCPYKLNNYKLIKNITIRG